MCAFSLTSVKGGRAIVVIEHVLSVVGDVEVLEAVVVIVPTQTPWPQPVVSQARLFRHIGERAVVIVAVEMAGGGFAGGQAFQFRAVSRRKCRASRHCHNRRWRLRARRSMMYFLCFRRRKSRRGEPGFRATSVKCTMGLAFALSELPSANARELADGIESQAQSPRKADKPEKRGMENHQFANDTKVYSGTGQPGWGSQPNSLWRDARLRTC